MTTNENTHTKTNITKLLNKYETRKKQLTNTNANIYFNKQCQKHKLTPNYIKIKINNTNTASQKTLKQAQKLWIKNEINELYKKKNNLTLDIYKLHLELAKLLEQKSWNYKYNKI